MHPMLGGSMNKPLNNTNKLFDKDIRLSDFKNLEDREEGKKAARAEAKL